MCERYLVDNRSEPLNFLLPRPAFPNFISRGYRDTHQRCWLGGTVKNLKVQSKYPPECLSSPCNGIWGVWRPVSYRYPIISMYLAFHALWRKSIMAGCETVAERHSSNSHHPWKGPGRQKAGVCVRDVKTCKSERNCTRWYHNRDEYVGDVGDVPDKILSRWRASSFGRSWGIWSQRVFGRTVSETKEGVRLTRCPTLFIVVIEANWRPEEGLTRAWWTYLGLKEVKLDSKLRGVVKHTWSPANHPKLHEQVWSDKYHSKLPRVLLDLLRPNTSPVTGQTTHHVGKWALESLTTSCSREQHSLKRFRSGSQ